MGFGMQNKDGKKGTLGRNGARRSGLVASMVFSAAAFLFGGDVLHLVPSASAARQVSSQPRGLTGAEEVSRPLRSGKIVYSRIAAHGPAGKGLVLDASGAEAAAGRSVIRYSSERAARRIQRSA